MDQNSLSTKLADLHLGAVRYFAQLGSTNDEASRWAAQGAPDLALVVADEQTSGRGRRGHQWFTPPNAALAFSLVVYPTLEDAFAITRMTALGAMAVCDALRNRFKLPAKIKWPNDVLIERRKVCGVLTEAQWNGDRLASLVLGVGINVAAASVPPDGVTSFPSTCVETALGAPVDRLELLHAVLVEFLRWRPRLSSADFLRAWEANLAFRNEWVQISASGGADDSASPLEEGQVVGLETDGALKLRNRFGDVYTVAFGEVRLRPTAG